MNRRIACMLSVLVLAALAAIVGCAMKVGTAPAERAGGGGGGGAATATPNATAAPNVTQEELWVIEKPKSLPAVRASKAEGETRRPAAMQQMQQAKQST